MRIALIQNRSSAMPSSCYQRNMGLNVHALNLTCCQAALLSTIGDTFYTLHLIQQNSSVYMDTF